MKVAVVGAGICGLSAARFLVGRGHQVSLFERFPLFHSHGSSHGRSRIVRKAYPDAFYTAIMAEGYPLWRDLEHAAGRKLLHECGLVYFGKVEAPSMISMEKGLAENSVPYTVFDSGSASRIMPALRLNPGEVAVFTPEAGWAEADAVLTASWQLAQHEGAVLHRRTATTQELETEYDAFVACAGAWTREFVPGLDVEVSQRTVAYIRGDVEGPVWIEDSAENAYGFPSEPGSGSFKVGIHGVGTALSIEDSERPPDPRTLTLAKEAASRRFGVSNPEVVETLGCLYTSTPDEDFRLGRVGSNGFFASACSGHGFKFGPWIGRTLADFVEGKDKPENHPRFNWPRVRQVS